MEILKRVFLWGLVAAFAVVAILAPIAFGWVGSQHDAGTATNAARPGALVAARVEAQHVAALARDVETPKQILFGDLHVHSTYSSDAFMRSLPNMTGEGAHPPAESCDFARYCSALDFWSINDHSEGLSPRMWGEIKQSIRQCNDVAGSADNPDMVSFLGFEWTQMSGPFGGPYYGHKNVIFVDTEEDVVPMRPIGSFRFEPKTMFKGIMAPPLSRLRESFLDFRNRQLYYDFYKLIDEGADTPYCAEGVDVHDLPVDCMETALTPKELFGKLDEWAIESIVIPHGLAWGLNAPPGGTWDLQIAAGQHDPKRQIMVEVYSGHGNSEEYRDWRAVRYDENGERYCPEPSDDYMPSCWWAGEIIRERCLEVGEGEVECETRARTARDNYLLLGNSGFNNISGTVPDDWLDAGQCRDCFLAAWNLRPGFSAQYALAMANLDEPKETRTMRMAMIGSSDSHRGRPGGSYKEFDRHGMTDAHGPPDAAGMIRWRGKPKPRHPYALELTRVPMSNYDEFDRRAGMLTTSGLAAVHSAGRDRQAIWDGMKRKEVYATSGPRILLWFDLLNAEEDATTPMGSEVAMGTAPKFRVRAAGAFKQKPGCPEHVLGALDPERLARLCHDECYNPSDERHLIRSIEVVRVRPKTAEGEDMGELIEAPWRTFSCEADPSGCTVEFEDPEFVSGGRETVYYARAIQEATPKVNGGGMRCDLDEEGNCIKLNLCTGGWPTDPEDDCLWPAEERAWSSPIWIDYEG